MAAIGSALLGLIFLKVVIVLLGALLYAIGPVMIALVPTDGGIVIARAWASAALALVMLPLAWSTILAVGALLINDSSTAGPLIAGQGSIASRARPIYTADSIHRQLKALNNRGGSRGAKIHPGPPEGQGGWGQFP